MKAKKAPGSCDYPGCSAQGAGKFLRAGWEKPHQLCEQHRVKYESAGGLQRAA